jgi:hypothetical protein
LEEMPTKILLVSQKMEYRSLYRNINVTLVKDCPRNIFISKLSSRRKKKVMGWK